MINYEEKGLGLHVYLESLGLGIKYDNELGWLPIDATADIQTINTAISTYIEPIPNLSPRQFKRFLLISGLDTYILSINNSIKSVDLDLYIDITSQLEGGSIYIWKLFEHLLVAISYIVTIPVEYSITILKDLWITQSQHKIDI